MERNDRDQVTKEWQVSLLGSIMWLGVGVCPDER